MKRHYSPFRLPRHRQPARQTKCGKLPPLGVHDREMLEDLHDFTGLWFGRNPRVPFQLELRDWLEQHPDQFVPYMERSHARIWRYAKQHGIEKADDLPKAMRNILSECCQGLAGSLFSQASTRLQKELPHSKGQSAIDILDQTVSDCEKAVDYILDVAEPERSEWLAIIEPFRANAHRTAQKLRREGR